VDLFLANSQHVAGRIRAAYGREATVVYPPVDTSYWTRPRRRVRDKYFLLAGRLVTYKRPEVVVRAAELARAKLVVAGDGPELGHLKQIAGGGVEFVVNPSRGELRELYRRARALVVPGVEDFGMTMIEAQACGTPVLAYGAGGALEAVADGRTGTLYAEPTPRGLAAEMLRFDADRFDGTVVRRHAQRFGLRAFDGAIERLVARTPSAAAGTRPATVRSRW
jgi:glycosyltransferase involved in cell wall biosynthesis